MRLNRRQVLTATGVAGASIMLGSRQAATASDEGQVASSGKTAWHQWIAANRGHVGVVIDDGRGGRVAHRPFEEQILCSAIKVVHAAGFALAVEQGRVKPSDQVRVGDWEKYYIGLDGGAHQEALKDLGIPFGNGFTADNPDHLVTLDAIVKVTVLHSDNAGADFIRTRVGDATLRAAAVRCGWPQVDVRSVMGEMLFLVLPERAPAPGTPVALRRRIGDDLAAQAISDPQLQLEIIGRFPHIPTAYDAQAVWAQGTWAGTAAGLTRIHRTIAGGHFPLARTHLERAYSGALPPGVRGIGLKGGSLPGALTLAYSVRWEDGRTGTAVVLASQLPEERFSAPGELVDLVLGTLLDPAALRELEHSLVG